MKRRILSGWVCLSVFLLSGCISIEPALSGKAFDDYQKSIKAYIEYWEKPGMTMEGRQEDSWACGAGPTILGANNVAFSQEQAQEEKRSGERDDITARERLRDKWKACMKAKGYDYVVRK